MKRERDFPDLDALVLAEIASAQGRRDSQRHPPPEERRQTTARALQEPPPTPTRKARTVTQIHGDERERMGMNGEEAELLNDPYDLAMEIPEEEQSSAPSLFSPEETAFMHRAVGFLSGRENADMILGQIWEQVTTDHPEGFYQLDEEHLPMGLASPTPDEAGPPTQPAPDDGSSEPVS